jgi:hypothetical protein
MPYNAFNDSSKSSKNPENLRPDKEPQPYLTTFLILIPLLEILLAGVGLYYLGFAEGGVLGWVKLILFCATAYLVAYAIYRMGIEKGVPLVAAKSKLAGPLSGLSVFLVGAAFFSVTAPGLTITAVEEMRLTAHLEEVGSYVDGRLSVADQAAELVPIMQTMADDLSARTEQESASGFGPIAEALNALRGRVSGLAAQMTASIGLRQEVIGQIQAQRLAMEQILADESVSIWTRRADLRSQQARLMSLLSELDQAVPVSIVASYASELQGGVLIPNRPDANAAINRTLNGYADTLKTALADYGQTTSGPPTFPSKTGAMDTFQYAGKFAPVFMFAWLVDMAFPLSLWAYVLMTVIAHSPQVWAKPRKNSDFDDLTGLRPINLTKVQTGQNDEGARQAEANWHGPHSRPSPHSNGKTSSPGANDVR